MATATVSTTTAGGRRSLAATLLARRGTVYLPAATGKGPAVDSLAGVTLIEADLLDRGYLMAPALRDALAALDTVTLADQGRALLVDIDQALGSHADHVPLFRNFPDSTPGNTLDFWVDRVLTVLFQAPEQPCVLCCTEGTVHAVSPCAHLVCAKCFDGSDFSACPICHRRIDPADPFLRPHRPRRPAGNGRALPDRLRVLTHGGDLTARSADAGHELSTLLARTGALSPQDTDDLETLLATRARADLSWLPQAIPGREIKARVLAWLLTDSAAHAVTVPAATGLITTATDVLRMVAVLSGGDAGLIEVPRVGTLSRPLRRALLSVLDQLDTSLVIEDMLRYPHAWKVLAERLHPFEYARRYPNATLAIAALREVRLADDDLSAQLRSTAMNEPSADAEGTRLRLAHWPGQVEAALAAEDVETAIALLARRPGELLRRLDHVLRLSDGNTAPAVLSALGSVVGRVSPAVLLSALGEIRTRSRQGRERVFFPKGGNARAHIVPDEREPLPAEVVERVVSILTAEVLRRAGVLTRVDVAVVDAALDGVIARSRSGAPRGRW
jgi:hypothetical protein